MKKLTLTFLLAAAAIQYSTAAEATVSNPGAATAPAAATAEPPTEAASTVATLDLKNKSSFVIQENGRNPFWPIGWKPAAKQVASPTTESAGGAEIQPNAFLVSSIVLDPRARFAIINGKAMTEGQVFGLQIGTQTYQITVKSIEDGRVILVRGRDQEIVAPLRRR